MPVGGAILGSAVIGAGANAAASSKAAKAAKKAATTNNAMLQADKDRAYATIDPYLQTGYQANTALSRIVNGTGYAGQVNPMAAAGGTDWNAYLQENPDAAAWVQSKAGSPDVAGKTPAQLAELHYQLDGQARGEFRPLPTVAAPAQNQMLAAGENPTYGPTVAPRTVMNRPSAPELDIGLDKYQKSPDYEFQLSEGNRAITANKSAFGGLESGDAMKRIATYSQDLANGDYSKWRDYTTGQRNFEASRYDQNFNVDSARSDAQYDSDRGYITSRFDKQLGDLFTLSGQGASAAGTAIGVGQNATNGMMANNNSAATVQGNAALSGANNVNQMLGAALNMYGQMNGGYSTGGGTPAPAPGTGYQPGRVSYTGAKVPY